MPNSWLNAIAANDLPTATRVGAEAIAVAQAQGWWYLALAVLFGLAAAIVLYGLWRGFGWQEAILPSVVLLAFAVVFGSIAVMRFRCSSVSTIGECTTNV